MQGRIYYAEGGRQSTLTWEPWEGSHIPPALWLWRAKPAFAYAIMGTQRPRLALRPPHLPPRRSLLSASPPAMVRHARHWQSDGQRGRARGARGGQGGVLVPKSPKGEPAFAYAIPSSSASRALSSSVSGYRSIRSGRRNNVRRSASRRRQRATRAWLPESNTSGTPSPR